MLAIVIPHNYFLILYKLNIGIKKREIGFMGKFKDRILGTVDK